MTACPVLFCVLGRHEGPVHQDADGYTYTEVTPPVPVVARLYFNGGE